MKTRLAVEVLVGKSDKPESRWFEKTVDMGGILPLFRTVEVQLTEKPWHLVRFSRLDEAVVDVSGDEPKLFLKWKKGVDLTTHPSSSLPSQSCDAFFGAGWAQCSSEPKALE